MLGREEDSTYTSLSRLSAMGEDGKKIFGNAFELMIKGVPEPEEVLHLVV